MSTTVDKIRLEFENCEFVEFTYPDIYYLDIGDIKESFSNFLNCIYKERVLNGFTLCIRKTSKPNIGLFSETTYQKRLKYHDVTHLTITYTDGACETFGVEWKEGDETKHSGQVCNVSNLGNIMYSSSTGGYNTPIIDVDEWDEMTEE